jgi:predicted MFS family arabinose efflux permease
VTVAYAALPALVVQAVSEDETGVANAVNSIARSVGQALGSTVAVTLIAASTDPATGFPRDSAYTGVGLIGALATLAVMGVAVVGMAADRRDGGGRRSDRLTEVEEATARAGEWSPVSGIR